MGFDGLSYASRALQSYQAALDVTGQNISQMSAPGYTRQRITPTPGAAPVAGISGSSGYIDVTAYTDTGVQRLRNNFLDHAYRAQAINVGSTSATSTVLQKISAVFDETRANGIIAASNQLNNALLQAGQKPADMQLRQAVLSQASALASTFQDKSNQLQQAASDAQNQMNEALASVNSALQQLATLNNYLPGNPTTDTNAVLDKRDRILDDLSKSLGITVAPQPQGDLVVYAGGIPLVFGHTARTLQATTDTSGHVTISTETGKPVVPSGGQLGALLTLQNDTIPGIVNRINTLATTLASNVNQRLANSYDLQGVSGSPMFKVFAGANGVATSPDVQFVSATGLTAPGTYDVKITQAAAQGHVQGRALTVAQVSGSGGTANQVAPPGATLTIQVGGNSVPLAIGGNGLSDVINTINNNPTLRNLVTASASGSNLVLTTQGISNSTADLTVTFNSPTNAFGLNAGGGGVQTTVETSAGARARLASNETLTFTNGAGLNTQITLTAGTIISTAVTQVNTVLQAAGIDVTAAFGAGVFSLTNNAYGSGANVKNTVTSSLDNSLAANGLGLMTVANTVGTIADAANAVLFNQQSAGQDVAGSISGNPATGVGQILTGTSGGPTGLALRFTGTAPPVGFDAGQISVTNGKPVLQMSMVLTDPGKLALATGSMQSAAALTSKTTPINPGLSLASSNTLFSVPLGTTSGTLLVNGQQVNWDNSQTLNDVLSSLPGVHATFDPASQTVMLVRDPSVGKTGPAITISDLTGNLAATLGLDTAVMSNGVPGSGDTAQSLMDAVSGPAVDVGQPPMGIEGMRVFESDIALQASLATQASTAAEQVQTALDTQRQQVSGVNIDQESVDLIQYQRAYESAVQLAKAQDSLLTTLISMVNSR
ncbi:MAG: flagellar hook-associated protein FlgK [Proteobacteria bacterium]|nr:flagellar hook-associated protein FlgK [Pseudomonadota bacterium]